MKQLPRPNVMKHCVLIIERSEIHCTYLGMMQSKDPSLDRNVEPWGDQLSLPSSTDATPVMPQPGGTTSSADATAFGSEPSTTTSSTNATAVGSQPSTTPSVTSTTAVEDAPVILDVPNLGTMDAASKKDTRKPAAASVRNGSQIIRQLNTSDDTENEQQEDLDNSSEIPGRFIFICAAILFSGILISASKKNPSFLISRNS